MRKSLQILLNPEMKALERAAVPQPKSLSRSLSVHHWRGDVHPPRNTPGGESNDFGLYLGLVLLLHPHPTHDSNHPPPQLVTHILWCFEIHLLQSVSCDHFQNAHGDFTSSVEGIRLRRGWGEDMKTLPYMPEVTDHSVLSHGKF